MRKDHESRASVDHRLPASPLSDASFQLLENLPVGIGVFRAIRQQRSIVDFVSVWKNRKFVDTLGLNDDLGRGHFERFSDAKTTLAGVQFLETIKRVLANGVSETVETYAPSPAQSYIFEVATTGVDEHFFVILRRIADAVDIDRRMHRLLQEQAFLFESKSIGYWKSVNRVFSWTNATFDRMLGYERNELLGKSSRFIYLSEELYEVIGQRLKDPEQASAGIHFAADFVRKDRGVGHFEVVLQKIGGDDELTLIGSCIDRSSEHVSTLALKKSEQRLMTSLKASGAAYFDWNLTSGEIEFDRGVSATLGASPANTFDGLLAMTHRNDRDVLRRYIQSLMENDTVSNSCEFRIRHDDGRWIWVLLRGSVVEFDGSNGHQPVRVAGTITDVTATKSIERETEHLLHRLDYLIKERISPHERFASNSAAASLVATLSRRQTEVLRLIASGNTSSEIANSLHISETTVQSHRREISQKLGLKNIAALTRFAIEAGL